VLSVFLFRQTTNSQWKTVVYVSSIRY
jgi:hypothetical protein